MSAPVPCSLTTLHSHSIFAPSAGTAGIDTDWEVLDKPSDSEVGTKRARLAVRDNDLFVAVGNEVRMVTLTGESWDVSTSDGRVGRYKTLVSPQLNFPIVSLVLNPTKRLLAVHGQTQIVVLLLPKPGWAGGGGLVRCRTISIDSFQYSPSSPVPIVKVRWHPLAEGGQSLWILSADGKLREYDLQTPTDPAQVYTILSSAPSSSKFSAIDPLSRYATSFAFGPSSRAGWGELAIHALIANGDMYTLCPVLPLRAQLQLSHIQRLKAYAAQVGGIDAQEWVDALARQVPEDQQAPAGPTRSILSRSTVKPAQAQAEREALDRTVLVHPPHLTPSGGPAAGTHKAVERQGPVVLDPAPGEADVDAAATDLMMVEVAVGEEGDSLEVCLVVWSNDRVDIGVQVDSVEARWVGKRESVLPKMPIAESLSLFDEADEETNAPSFLRDDSDAGTIYVQSESGVTRLKLGEWAAGVLDGRDESIEVALMVGSTSSPVEGCISVDNASLGYGMLALASTNQLAVVELDHPSTAASGPSASATLLPPRVNAAASNTSPDSKSLLSEPYDFPGAMTACRAPKAFTDARAALLKLPAARQPLERIAPDIMRAVITVLSALHAHIHAVRAQTHAAARRVDLQVQEYERQLGVLRRCAAGVQALRERDIKMREEEVIREQEELDARAGRVMRAFRDEYVPGVGTVEKRWFDEARRVKGRIGGSGGYGVGREVGLEQRVKAAQEQLAAIKAARRELEHRAGGDAVQDLGGGEAVEGGGEGDGNGNGTRLRPLESALTARSDELRRLMDKVERLTRRVETALDKREGR